MTELTIDVKPTGTESAVVYAPFSEAQGALEDAGFGIISLSQNATLRIEQGKGSDVFRKGNYVRDGVLYVPNGTPKLVRNSPVLQAAKKATSAHRQGKEFFPTKAQFEEALADSVDFPSKNTVIPTNHFGSEELTVYTFGGEKQARAYGQLLLDAGISEMPVWVVDVDYVNEQSKQFARQLWLGYLVNRSELYGNSRSLNFGSRVRGVRNIVGEARAQKSSGTSANNELYAPEQVIEALHQEGIIGTLESRILETLRR